jgi:maltose O-acetyltransferase
MPTEWEKMVRGEHFDGSDPEVSAIRDRARDLCYDLNLTRHSEEERRAEIIAELFGSVGRGVTIQPPFFCDYGKNIHVSGYVFFNCNCVVLDVSTVHIGDVVLIGPNVQILTATHAMDAPTRRTKSEFGKPIKIGDEVWLGGGAIICPGVTIGARTVIGAGSVVTRDVPEGVFAAGNPCRVIRHLE